MDPKKQLLNRIPVKKGLIALSLVIGGGLIFKFVPGMGPIGKSSLSSGHWGPSHILEVYTQAWASLQNKVVALQHTDEENARLRYENIRLKLEVESTRFDCHSLQGENSTEHHKLKLTRHTGAPVGRTPASIAYHPPAELTPSQLYTLGISYLKGHEDEKLLSSLLPFLTSKTMTPTKLLKIS